MPDKQEPQKLTDMDDISSGMAHEVFQGLSVMFEQGVFTDLVVSCGDTTWHVHRVVLASRSSYFKMACEGPFVEATSHTIDLQEDDPEMVCQMMSAFYKGDYDDHMGYNDPLEFNAGMYGLAEKYRAPLLKSLTALKFETAVSEFGMTAISDLKAAIKVIYTTTLKSDRTLRQHLVPALRLHGQQLRDDKGFMELVLSGLADGEFILDLIDAWVDFTGLIALERIRICTICEEESDPSTISKCCHSCGHDYI